MTGCRAGAECQFAHDHSALKQSQSQPAKSQPSAADAQILDGVATGIQSLQISGNQPRPDATASHAQPQRPVSKVEQNNPREFQINQLRRRFRPQETSDDNGSKLSFGLVPSDPDFPFELDSLQCVLYVPASYPETGRPKLTVTNPEMEPAFQENVARGFDDIVDFTLRMNSRGTLLSWMNSIDKQLERLLTTLERGPKLTFVANVGSGAAQPEPVGNAEQPQSRVASTQPVAAPMASSTLNIPSRKSVFTAEQKAQAEKRRSTETKQLEARLGRIPLFQKRSDTSFIIPIQPNKKDRLPGSLQTVKTVKLLIPPLYPLEHSSIELQGNSSSEAKSVETGFAQWIEKNSQLNLVSQINYLASNMHNFAKTPLPDVAGYSQHENHETPSTDIDVSLHESAGKEHAEEVGDKPHLHVVPRPPEWSVPGPGSDSEETDESSFDDDSEEEEEEEGGAPVPAVADSPPGRGVALSFPFLELYGVELLELMHLAITIKCERCKESTDIKNVPHLKDQKDTPKIESCKKCANSMSIGECFWRVSHVSQLTSQASGDK